MFKLRSSDLRVQTGAVYTKQDVCDQICLVTSGCLALAVMTLDPTIYCCLRNLPSQTCNLSATFGLHPDDEIND